MTSFPVFHLRATAYHCNSSRPLHGRNSVLSLGDSHYEIRSCDRAAAVRQSQADGVDSPVAGTGALRAQPDGPAIRGDDDVVGRNALSESIVKFIARHLLDHYVAHTDGAVVADALDHLRDVHGVILVIGGTERDRCFELDDRRR